MRVVEVITDSNIGGAGVLLTTRLKHTDPSKFQTSVILPKGSALAPRIKALGIEVLTVSHGADRSLDPLSIGEYVTHLRRICPDLVNCHGAFSARIAARLCRVPCVIYTRHCAYPVPSWQRRFPGKYLIGSTQNFLADGVIAVAEAAKANLLDMGVSEPKIRVIINGVEGILQKSEEEKREIRQSLGIPEDAFVVGICARLEACKGHEDLLECASLLVGKSKQYRFLIIGDGTRRQALEEYAHRLGISDFVIFTGFRSDVSPYYNVMDLNVNCSRGTETSSLALSEGMSLGIPAVASDYGGNPYMVREGENGLLYPVGKSCLLAERIRRIADDPILYRILSAGARNRFEEELNALRMTKETERLYEAFGRERSGYISRIKVAKPK